MVVGTNQTEELSNRLAANSNVDDALALRLRVMINPLVPEKPIYTNRSYLHGIQMRVGMILNGAVSYISGLKDEEKFSLKTQTNPYHLIS